METKKGKLERKLREAKEKLVKAEIDYKELLKVQQRHDRYRVRVEKLTKMLSEL